MSTICCPPIKKSVIFNAMAELPETLPGFYRCPRCGRVSYNLNDRLHRYCGACKSFEPAPIGQPPLTLDPNDPLWWLELGAEPAWIQNWMADDRS
jgi:hypothetical protein